MKPPSKTLAKPAKKTAKTKPDQAALALTGESTGPDWSRARFLADRIKHAMRLSLAGQILLGHELQTIKIELGFLGSGRRKEKPHDAVFKSLNRSWKQWCNSEMNGMSDDTADRLIATYEAGKNKLKTLGGQPRLLGLLDTHPDKLDTEARNTLSALVDKVEWGESQKQLLEDFRIVKFTKASSGGDTSKDKTKKGQLTNEQLAFAFFSPVPTTIGKLEKAVGNIRLAPDYEGYLHSLPLHRSAETGPVGVSLHALKLTLEAALAGDLPKLLKDVNAVIAAKEKNQTAAA